MTPTPRQETGIAIIAATTMIILIIILSLCSCSTKQHVVETVYVHDTVFSHHTDTVVEVKIVHHTDTVRGHESHTYTINNVGDTVKEYHYFHEKETTNTVDSTYRYQAERDSLRHALMEEKQKTKVVIKEKVSLKWLLISIAAAAIAVIGIIRDERNRIKKKIQQNQ